LKRPTLFFCPNEKELVWSRKIIDAREQNSQDDAGVITFEGAMIERLHVAQARLVLAMHAAITKR